MIIHLLVSLTSKKKLNLLLLSHVVWTVKIRNKCSGWRSSGFFNLVEPEVWLLSGVCAVIRSLVDVRWCSAVLSRAQGFFFVCMMSGVCVTSSCWHRRGVSVFVFVFLVVLWSTWGLNHDLWTFTSLRCDLWMTWTTGLTPVHSPLHHKLHWQLCCCLSPAPRAFL